MNKLAIVILAAGSAQRFGQAKQLASIAGKPMLQGVVNQIGGIRDADVYVAVGAHFDEIKKRIDFSGVELIFNPNWSEGMGATIAHATSQLANDYAGIMFIAGDQPLIAPDSLAPMIEAWHENTELACCATYDINSDDSTVGIPAVFPKRLFTKLKLLKGDFGAKKILLEETTLLQMFLMPEAKIDIDHPDDLKKTSLDSK